MDARVADMQLGIERPFDYLISEGSMTKWDTYAAEVCELELWCEATTILVTLVSSTC